MTKTLTAITVLCLLLLSIPSYLFGQNCSNWLYLPDGQTAFVRVGDLNVSGNQVTVEAEFTRTTPYDPVYHGGDIVGKHSTQANTNYLLRPNLGAITTDAGFFEVNVCPIQLNVTYHAAMVYDGSTLKYYRDGVLLGQTAATGNLITQDVIPADIGYFVTQLVDENFVGYINEVRIWNVARTQAQIQANMFTSLPSPATQPGLLGYYVFDDLTNKQGNTVYNGVMMNSGGQIGQTNPYCSVTKPTGVTGTLTGSNTCNGAPGLLTFHSQAGSGPFTLAYTDGVTTWSQTNVMDGQPFAVKVQPTVSTTYTLVSIQDATNCITYATPGITATINPGNCTLCNGSLGDPILNATFGSGTGNSPDLGTVIPGATTSLTYQPTNGEPPAPTPLDGYYTISNEVPYNSSGPYWYTGGKDHTGDPNGYMLYENPGSTVGEFFRMPLTTLCGGGTYEFAAWFAESDNILTTTNPILPDLTFIVQTTDGTVLATYNTGPIPQLSSWTWSHHGFFFTLPPGVTSAIVRILDNNPGGTNLPGNDFAIDDITFRPCGPMTIASIAAGGSATICPGGQGSFIANVSSGYTNPAYQWQISSDSDKTWTDIPGATNTSLSVTAPSQVTRPIAYHYRILTAEAANIQSPSCRVASNDVILTVNVPPNTGFSFTQQPCNPLQVQLTGTAAAGLTYAWMVDGTNQPSPDPSTPSFLYTFSGYGSHSVTLSSAGAASCVSTTTEDVFLALTPAEIVQTPDTGICAGKPVPLSATAGLGFCWSPSTGLDNPSSTHPVATPAVTTKYHFTSLIAGANLVVNGDFSAGNTGFTSAYTYAANGAPTGVYYVGPNPGTWLPGSPSCTDHTNGSGNMLLVNGAQQGGAGVWSETIAVQPNTNYSFSAWLDNITTVNPAILQFSINGQPMGSQLTANVNTCVWDQFYTTWNSGSATTAVISIVNQNTVLSGNDFALDDISFAPVTMETDSVTIDVETPVVNATPASVTVCPGVAAPLQASGASTYSWSPATGLSDPASANPSSLLPPSSSGSSMTYTVTGTTARGCTATATSTVNEQPQLLTLGPKDSTICNGSQAQLYASGGNTYSWSPATSLNAPTSPDPVAILSAPTEFYLTVADLNNCPEEDSLFIGIRPQPVFAAPPDETVCSGFGVKLVSKNGPGYIYSWSPAIGLDDPSAPAPIASPGETTTYTLDISDSVCSVYASSFNTEVVVDQGPVVTVKKDNDIDCTVHSAQLHASGALYYNWSPATGLSTASSPDPVASVDSTTTYLVKGTNLNGCYNYDSVTVAVMATGVNTFVVPNAFTPNGDGHNDCFGIQRWGDVQLEEMQIFNRWGVLVFSTQSPSACWDGTFHGQLQPTGAYPYVIRAHTYCGEITRTGVLMLIR